MVSTPWTKAFAEDRRHKLRCRAMEQKCGRVGDWPVALHRYRVALPRTDFLVAGRELETLLVARCDQFLQLVHGCRKTGLGKRSQDVAGCCPPRLIKTE